MKFTLTICILAFCLTAHSQTTAFPDQCEGEWSGQMVMFRNGDVMDTIPCTMSIVEIMSDSVWQWQTVYSGDTRVEKDYRMIRPDSETNYYILDEGDGLELRSYHTGNSLYSNFEVQGSLLTSRYTLQDEVLIFEITSGTIRDTTTNNIVNYTVPIVQYSVLRRVD